MNTLIQEVELMARKKKPKEMKCVASNEGWGNDRSQMNLHARKEIPVLPNH
jgi:hypothetical protein